MPAYIRPNRPEVSRAFPIAGFTIRTGISPSWVEVAVATDPNLLFDGADAQAKRKPNNFWSSRVHDLLPVERGEVVYLIPPKVMSRFVGSQRLYYALAVYREKSWNNPEVVRIPIETVPYINISPSFTGRGRGLMDIVSSGGGLTGNNNQYVNESSTSLVWGGDAATPGDMTSVFPPSNGNTTPSTSQTPPTSSNRNGSTAPATDNGTQQPAGTAQGFAYDDGFEPSFWMNSQPQQGYSGMEQITQSAMGISNQPTGNHSTVRSHAMGQNYSPSQQNNNSMPSSRAYIAEDDYENYGIEAPILDDAGSAMAYSYSRAMEDDYENYGIEAPIPDDASSAIAYTAQPLEDKSLGGTVAGKIGNAVIKRIADSTDGDINWELDRLNGLIYPYGDESNAGTAAYTTKQMSVAGLWIENLATDRITADFEIDWQYNGRSLGNINIREIRTNDAVGWGLKVTAHIVKDANSYRPTNDPNGETYAAVDIIFTYHFSRTIGSDSIGVIEYKLYGNGTFNRTSNWTQ